MDRIVQMFHLEERPALRNRTCRAPRYWVAASLGAMGGFIHILLLLALVSLLIQVIGGRRVV